MMNVRVYEGMNKRTCEGGSDGMEHFIMNGEGVETLNASHEISTKHKIC
jgi:hypothetical protein